MAISVAVAEDGDGFIWAGTPAGVARWDGYQFRTYRFEPGTPGALPDNLVQVLHRDSAGRLWVGTSGAGLARFEPATQRFVTLGAGPQGLSHVSVRAIVADGRGGLWVGSDGGLDWVDAASGRVTQVPMGAGSRSALPGERVVALLLDRDGALWAGTTAGLFRRDAGQERFQAVALAAPAGQPAGIPEPQPESLMQDSAGRIWVGTARSGAFVITGRGAAPQQVRETDALPPGSTALSSLRVLSLVEAQPGEVWIGTVGGGIVSVEAASGRTRRMSYQTGGSTGLLDNAVRGLYRDRSGLVWVASNGGLSRLDPRAQAVLSLSVAGDPSAPTQARTEISALLAAADGSVWLGTHADGVEIIDPQSGRAQPRRALRPDPTRPREALQPDVVMGLAQVADGSVFIGSYRGLYRASADGARVARVELAGRKPGAGAGPLLNDGPRLWVGGLLDGLWVVDLASGTGRAAVADPVTQLTDRRITALARGPGGEIWIGTRNGLNRYQPETGQVLRIHAAPAATAGTAGNDSGLAAGFVTSLLVDRKGRLWVGTYGGGVHLMDETGGPAAPRFKPVGITQGLPDNNTNALLQDDAGFIWVSTDRGLGRVDPATLRAVALGRAEGVALLSYWSNSAARTAAGELLFGASGGLTVVRPRLLVPWSHQPPTVAADIRVGGRSVPVPAPGSPLQVPADANRLDVVYAALDYSAPQRNLYAHRLEGFDADWVSSNANERLASYAGLPPGDYRLQLRGSNRDGVFSGAVLTLPVQVLAAWHQTLWARALVVLAALGSIAAVVRFRTRVLESRRAQLERLVDERTAELQRVSRALEEKSRVLEQASTVDPLTGLHNRRFLADHIAGALAASQRRALGSPARPGPQTGGDTLFFLIDIDHFKRVNDDFGHAAGDAVLVQLAQCLHSALRESDYLVRWGGEEFLAVALDTERERADELAERLRASVAGAPLRLDDGQALPLTCSVGYACWPFLPEHPQALGWQDVVKLADAGLLAAKRLGRNAWVGLQSGTQAQADGLLLRVLGAPVQALRLGEISAHSSHSAEATALALERPST
jgi:diguanylate cyclase (GGDEF)-like protein